MPSQQWLCSAVQSHELKRLCFAPTSTEKVSRAVVCNVQLGERDEEEFSDQIQGDRHARETEGARERKEIDKAPKHKSSLDANGTTGTFRDEMR